MASKRAVVIGINRYADEKINLSGAVHDATEIRDILTEGDEFTIDNGHFLINEQATSENIRQAISDLFWKAAEPCDIALFYFSGHGLRDHFKHGYLLPHDADRTNLFIKGIDIEGLKKLFLHNGPRRTSIMILDCCYSGIATQAEKGDSDQSEHLESFNEAMKLDKKGSGRFILASADAEKAAHEEELEHALDGGKHFHGLFSFQLIEGLRHHGKRDVGRVSLGALIEHLEKAFNDPKRQPQISVDEAFGMDRIFLAKNREMMEAEFNERLAVIDELLADEGISKPTSSMAAIQRLSDLEKRGLPCRNTGQYDKLDRFVSDSSTKVRSWWIGNRMRIYPEIGKTAWHKMLDSELSRFKLDSLMELNEEEFSLVSLAIEICADQKKVRELVEEVGVLERNARSVGGEISVDSGVMRNQKYIYHGPGN